MTNYPFTIHNIYSSDQRNIERLVYDTSPDKYGYFYGVMEVIPLIIPITPEEDEVEDINDLLTLMTTPEKEVVIVMTNEVLFCDIDISRIELGNHNRKIQTVKVFFKAKKDNDRTNNSD